MAGHGNRGWTIYTPSHAGWGPMDLKCDSYTATNNGTAYNTAYSLNNFWPLHREDLRFVYGKDNTGAKDTCAAMAAGGTLFTVGTSFSDEFGNTYTVIGLRNERFKVSHLK